MLCGGAGTIRSHLLFVIPLYSERSSNSTSSLLKAATSSLSPPTGGSRPLLEDRSVPKADGRWPDRRPFA
jgi:hypothetical protein